MSGMQTFVDSSTTPCSIKTGGDATVVPGGAMIVGDGVSMTTFGAGVQIDPRRRRRRGLRNRLHVRRRIGTAFSVADCDIGFGADGVTGAVRMIGGSTALAVGSSSFFSAGLLIGGSIGF